METEEEIKRDKKKARKADIDFVSRSKKEVDTAHVVRHVPGESLVYEVKIGSGGVVSPVKTSPHRAYVDASPVEKKIAPKPISPKNM